MNLYSDENKHKYDGSADRSSTPLPDGWLWVELGAVTQLIVGQSPPSSTYNTKGLGLPFFQGKAEFGELYPTPVKYCSDPKRIAQPNDVLISVRAPVGPTNLCYEVSCIGRGLVAIRPEIGMPSRYFLYFLRSIENDWGAYTTGTTFDAINSGQLSSRKIPLAPLNEQHRIVEEIESYFTRLDAAVASLRRAQARLKRYKTSLLKAACEGRLVPTEVELARTEGRDYEPASVLLERILAERRSKWEADEWTRLVERAKQQAAKEKRKEAGHPLGRGESLTDEEWRDLPEKEYKKYLPKNDQWKKKYPEPASPQVKSLPKLPTGWSWATVDQIGYISGGLTQNQKRSRLELTLPYLRVANVYANRLELDDVQEIGVRPEEVDRALLAKDDLLIVEGNGSRDQIGRVAIWDGSISVCLHQNHLIKVRFIHEQLVKYALLWLLSVGGREQILQVASSTSGLYTLSLSKVANLPLPLPPIQEQVRIVEEVERRISVADDKEISVQRNQKRAERTRQSILRKAFYGKLVPQDSGNELALLLLERIQTERIAREEAAKSQRKQRSSTRGTKMANNSQSRRSLYEVVVEANKPIKPADLFEQARFTIELIDAFYEELRREVFQKKRLTQVRLEHSDIVGSDVLIKVAGHED
jgi:type I restriction enzyme S subunit